MKNQVSAKLSPKEMREIKRLLRAGLYINVSDFVRDAVRKTLAELSEVTVDRPEIVQKRVYDYFASKGGTAYPDDAARDLGYSVLTILDALERLRAVGKAKELQAVPAS